MKKKSRIILAAGLLFALIFTACAQGDADEANVTIAEGQTSKGNSASMTDDMAKTWIKKRYGGSDKDNFCSVTRTQDGGYAAAGYSYGNNEDYSDFVIAKFDADGNTTWVKNYGGSHEDIFESIVQTDDGGYVAAGYSESLEGDLPGKDHADYYDVTSDFVIARFDAEGNKMWIKRYGYIDDDEFHSIVQTQDGGYAAAGYCESFNNDMLDGREVYNFIIAKFDVEGNETWIKNYGGDGDSDGFDFFYSIVQTQDGGYAATGHSTSSGGDLPGNNGGDDFVIAKFDADGNKTWIKNYGGTGTDDFESIIQTADGGYAAAGNSNSPDGDLPGTNSNDPNSCDFVIAKFDAEGNKTWIKNYGGSYVDVFHSIFQTQDGGYVAKGYSESVDGDMLGKSSESADVVIAKFDADGNKTWIKNYDDSFYSIVQTQDGSYEAAGFSYSSEDDLPGDNGGRDFIIAKFDAEGNMK